MSKKSETKPKEDKNSCETIDRFERGSYMLIKSIESLRSQFEHEAEQSNKALEELASRIERIENNIEYDKIIPLINKRHGSLKAYRITWRHEIEFKAHSDKAAQERWESLDLYSLKSEIHKANKSSVEFNPPYCPDMSGGFVELVSFECETDDYREVSTTS
jgi:hypothetical protein